MVAEVMRSESGATTVTGWAPRGLGLAGKGEGDSLPLRATASVVPAHGKVATPCADCGCADAPTPRSMTSVSSEDTVPHANPTSRKPVTSDSAWYGAAIRLRT